MDAGLRRNYRASFRQVFVKNLQRNLPVFLAASLFVCCLIDVRISFAQESGFSRLVEQLADPDIAIRSRAARTLADAGTNAFDALYEQRDSSDLEQRMAIERLMIGIKPEWPDEIPNSLRQLTRAYETASRSQRIVLLEMIGRHQTADAASILVSVIHYEQDDAISRAAAIRAIRLLDECEDVQLAKQICEMVIKSTSGSQRVSCSWIQTRVQSHDDSALFAARWTRLVNREFQSIRNRNPDLMPVIARADRGLRIDISIQNALWVIEELLQRNRRDEALPLINRVIENAGASHANRLMYLFVRYNLTNEARRFASEHVDLFENDPLLLYHLAAVEGRSGGIEEAEKVLEKANQNATQYVSTAIEIAVQIQRYGYQSFANDLFEIVIALQSESTVFTARARLLLADQHFSFSRFGAASDVLSPLMNELENNSSLERTIAKGIGCSADQIGARVCLYDGLEAAARGDRTMLREMILEGLEHDPDQADLLIIAYNCQWLDPESRQLIDRLLSTRTQNLKIQIESLRARRIGPGNPRLRKSQERQLAALANSLAWLDVNTDGDPRECLRCIQIATRLVPDSAAYLDTEARCRFASGDQAGAIRAQQLACRLEPASLAQKRRLASYRRYRAATLQSPLAGTQNR